MRITGGEFCGRRLKAPPGDAVRPTQDRVREALFSMLAAVVPSCAFLDLYAGSGAVGLEALSRGARRVTFVEQETRHAALLRGNLAALRAEAEVVCCEVSRWLKGPGRGRLFDVVFADPPYALARAGGFGVLMGALAVHGVAGDRCFFVAEMPVDREAEAVEGWELLRDRTYGHTRLALYRRRASGEQGGGHAEERGISGDV